MVGLLSCPYTAISSRLPPCAWTNFSLCTNMPPEPQHESRRCGPCRAQASRRPAPPSPPDCRCIRTRRPSCLRRWQTAIGSIHKPPEHIFGFLLLAAQANPADQVDQLAKGVLSRVGRAYSFGRCSFDTGVLWLRWRSCRRPEISRSRAVWLCPLGTAQHAPRAPRIHFSPGIRSRSSGSASVSWSNWE